MIEQFTIASAQYEFTYLKSFSEWKEKCRDLVKQSADRGANIIVFPELASFEIASSFPPEVRLDLKLSLCMLATYEEEFIEFWAALSKEFSLYICAPSISSVHRHRVYFFSPYGTYGHQDKNFSTALELEMETKSDGFQLSLFETDYGTFGIQLSSDISEPAFTSFLKAHGAHCILVPATTSNMADSNKIHLAARSRAMENQCFVVVSQTVGSLPWSKLLKFNTGFSAVYSPIGVPFSDDGRLERGKINSAEWVFSELDLSHIVTYRKSHESSPLLKPPRTKLQFFNLQRP